MTSTEVCFKCSGPAVTVTPTGYPACVGDDCYPEGIWPPPGDPKQVARRIEQLLTDDDVLILRRWRATWMRWRGTHYVEEEDASVRADVYNQLEHAVYLDQNSKEPKVVKWQPTSYRVRNVLEALESGTYLASVTMPPTWILGDGPRHLVAVKNGLLNVATRELVPGSPRFFNLSSVPFDYEPSVGPPLRWLEFLNQLWPDDPEAIATLQEWFGYCLSGRTDQHKILLIVGPTRAGKGVIGRVLTSLVGRDNVAAPTLASLSTNFGLSPLIGQAIALVSDARLGGRDTYQVVERLLSISGEDTLTVDRKYREPWTGRLTTRFVILTNELPRLGDASGAIAGRFVVLMLKRSFRGQEDFGLTDTLMEELPAILNWSLDGLARLNERGRISEPESSREAVTSLQDLASPVAAFVRDRCARAFDKSVTVDAIYAAWKEWCEENGRARPGSKATFGRDLAAVDPSIRRTRPEIEVAIAGEMMKKVRVYTYEGIALSTNNDDSLGHLGRDATETAPGPSSPSKTPLFPHSENGHSGQDPLHLLEQELGATEVDPEPDSVEVF